MSKNINEYEQVVNHINSLSCPLDTDGTIFDAKVIKNMLFRLSTVFDVVRLVDVNDMIEYTVSDNYELLSNIHNCYNIWGKQQRCDNCISSKVLKTKQTFSKFEFIESIAYFVIAKYVVVDGVPFVLELARRFDDEIFFNVFNQDNFAHTIKNYTHKLYSDPLTDAYNRNYLDDQLRHLKISALVMLDLDSFKQINDTFGHIGGDVALKTVTSIIKNEIRHADSLIRYGGDEFLLLFSQIPPEKLYKRLEKIRKKVENYKFYDYPNMHITISAGGVACKKCEDDAIQRADDLLYEAKKTRNNVLVDIG